MRQTPKATLWILWSLVAAFLLRVLGQLSVALWDVPFLPPMEEWFSGVLPYPKLLASQIAILALLGKICTDLHRNRGYFARPQPWLAAALPPLARIYLAVMILRYVYRMALYPHERWTGGSIPIFFHCVLASFLMVLGSLHVRWVGAGKNSSRVRRILGWGVAAILVLAWSLIQLGPWMLSHGLGSRPVEQAVRIDRDVPMTTSDSLRLFSTIYHPRRLSRTPTILVRAPLPQDWKTNAFSDLIGRYWAEHGYTVVVQRSRGCPPSEGKSYPLRDDRRDGKETLAWLAAQPWFNGKVGTWGGSAFGYSQWAMADQANPGPSAMMIYEAGSDPYRMLYPGGSFAFSSALFWALRTAAGAKPSEELLARGFAGNVMEADDRALRDLDFYNDWASHPDKDAYWRGLDMSVHIPKLQAPVFMLAGWYDPFLPAQLHDYAALQRQARPEVAAACRLVIGPWTHAQSMTLPGGYEPRNFRLETLAYSLPWFDQFLRPHPAPPAKEAAVRLFVMGKNVWRDEESWPLARAISTRYFLRSGGRLETEAPSQEGDSSHFVFDPRHIVPTRSGAVIGHGFKVLPQEPSGDRLDVLAFSTAVLAEDVEVTGPLSLVCRVRTEAAADFAARLMDVHPDGNAYLVSDANLRRKSAAAGETDLKLEFWPTSQVFLKGHRIRLEISSSNYPQFDLGASSHNTVYHSQSKPSYLVLPVVPRS